MVYFLVENRAVRAVVKARDSEAAVRRFRARYPAYAHLGTYTVRLFGPPYLASPRGALTIGAESWGEPHERMKEIEAKTPRVDEQKIKAERQEAET